MKQGNDTIHKAFETTSLLFSNENTLKLFDSLKTLGFAPGDGCKEKELKKALKNEQVKIKDIEKETDILTSEIEKCGSETSALVKTKKLLEERIEEVRNEAVPSNEVKEDINKIKVMCKSYKKITGIHWDYSAPENIAKGYIVGPVKNYVKAFEFPVDDDLPSNIWQEIEKSSCTSNELKGKENISNIFMKVYKDC